MARVRVVLVRPESAANIGAVARVVRNAGLAGLDLVAPGDWRTVECWRTAWGAQEVLEEAREFETLEASLEGVGLALALSGRRAGGDALLDIREAAEAVAASGPEEDARLVFGPESSGLTNEEIAGCGRRVFIPAHSAQPSYNLSHAVAIAAYEIHRARHPGAPPGPRRATHDEKERLLVLLREGLTAVGALPRVNTEGFFRDWQALVQRSDVTSRELKLLEHMARKMARAGDRR